MACCCTRLFLGCLLPPRGCRLLGLPGCRQDSQLYSHWHLPRVSSERKHSETTWSLLPPLTPWCVLSLSYFCVSMVAISILFIPVVRATFRTNMWQVRWLANTAAAAVTVVLPHALGIAHHAMPCCCCCYHRATFDFDTGLSHAALLRLSPLLNSRFLPSSPLLSPLTTTSRIKEFAEVRQPALHCQHLNPSHLAPPLLPTGDHLLQWSSSRKAEGRGDIQHDVPSLSVALQAIILCQQLHLLHDAVSSKPATLAPHCSQPPPLTWLLPHSLLPGSLSSLQTGLARWPCLATSSSMAQR